jgi:hypothetical protein
MLSLAPLIVTIGGVVTAFAAIAHYAASRI